MLNLHEVANYGRSATKNEIRDWLYDLAAEAGNPISGAKADKLANKFKRGVFDPELVRVVGYSDPTGEEASTNADKEALAKALKAAA